MSITRVSSALAFALLLTTPIYANAPPPPVEAAQGVAPEIFVKSLYDTLAESEAVSPELGAAMLDSVVLSHFTPDLLALYKTAYDIPEPIIDGNVIWDSQEWDPKVEVATKTTAKDATTATVEATYKIGTESRTVTYALKALREGWQIDDITGGAGSMRKWLTEGIAGYKPQ